VGLRRLSRGRRQPEAAIPRTEAADGPVIAAPTGGLAVLLRPDREVVRFTGRDEELRLLRAWGESPEPRSVQVIVGASGVGKSRLARQLAAEWEAAGALWRPVADGNEARAIAAARAVSPGRLLLVADEAETRSGLASLLIALMADPGPVRVLLVARSLGEWWDRLTGQAAAEARPLLDVPPIRLGTPLSGATPDADVAAAAVPDFARALSVAEPVDLEVERSALRLPVLLLHVAALRAVAGSAARPDRRARVVIGPDAVGGLLEWEARYWRQRGLAAGLADDEVLIKQAVAATTVTGVRNTAEARSVLARLPQLSGAAPQERADWARWLSSLYPSTEDGTMGLLAPGLLAQTFVAGQLADDPVLARSVLRQLPPGPAEHALTMLAEAAAHHDDAREVLASALRYDLPHLAVAAGAVATRGHPEVAGWLCDALGGAPAAPEELAQIALDLPHPSPVLAEANLIATLRARESLPMDPAPQAGAEWDERAALLLAELDASSGRPGSDDDAQPGSAGVGRRHRPELAASLTSLAVRLYQAGRYDEALRAGQASVRLYRELAGTERSRFRPELAAGLINLGVWLSSLGRTAEAVPPTREAASIFRELTAAGAGRYRPDLATALTNLGIWHSGQGQIEEALAGQQEAVAIFRELAAADPGRYRADLATSLTNLGIWFSRAGRPDDAVPVEQEAVMLRRELAAADPDRYRAELATSLTNLAVTFRELERPADALGPAREVVVSYRELAAVDPDTYRPELARALAGLGAMCAELGHPGAGLAPAKEAVAIRRKLADAVPAAHQLGLSHSLDTLAAILSALGHEDEAAKAREEAATIASEAAG